MSVPKLTHWPSQNEDLFLKGRKPIKGHVGLSEALANEVKARSDAKKALARAARTQAHGAQGVVPAGRCAPSGGGVMITPTHCGGRWDLGPF